MGPKRKKQRLRELGAALEDSTVAKTRQDVLEARADEQLFVVDSTGSARKRKKIQREVRGGAGGVMSKNEEKLLKKRYLNKPKTQAKQNKALEPGTYDPWADAANDEAEVNEWAGKGPGGELAERVKMNRGKSKTSANAKSKTTARKATRGKVLSVPAEPGQSYNPTEHDHQDLVAEALALELRREKAQQEANKPISQGMAPETLALIVPEDEISSDDSSDSESEGAGEEELDTKKKQGKLTRAERNKQKRRKAAEVALRKKQELKAQRRAMHSLSSIAKDVDQTAEKRRERREAASKRKADRNALPRHGFGIPEDLVNIPSIDVSLQEELQGSLRLMKVWISWIPRRHMFSAGLGANLSHYRLLHPNYVLLSHKVIHLKSK
ncbi:unnamed protein product [Chrysoparadoxa australica]